MGSGQTLELVQGLGCRASELYAWKALELSFAERLKKRDGVYVGAWKVQRMRDPDLKAKRQDPSKRDPNLENYPYHR